MFGIFNSRARAKEQLTRKFFQSCAAGNWPEASKYIEAGISVDATDAYGNTALMEAAQAGQALVVKKLIAAGAEIEARNSSGATALIQAASSGAVDAMCALIDAGASVSPADQSGRTALSACLWSWHYEAAKMLIDKKADVNIPLGSSTPLVSAAETGRNDFVTLFLDAGAQPDQADPSGKTPLGGAIAGWNFEAAKLLIERKADVNVRLGNNTLLGHAVEKHRNDFVKLLVDAGAESQPGGKNRKTPLMVAAQSGNTDILKLLLAAPDPGLDARDASGWTALALATAAGNYDVVKLLVEAGADIETVDNQGLTPFSRAAVDCRTEIMSLLHERGARIDVRDNDGDTPLLVAAANDYVEVARLLLQWGADLEVRDGENNTALTIAEDNSEDIENLIKEEQKRRARGDAPSQKARALPPVPAPAATTESPARSNDNQPPASRHQFKL